MADNIIYGLGDKLKQLREKQRLTQQEIADRLSVDKNTVSRYERDEITPPIDKLVKLAVMLNVSLDYLVGIGKESYLILNEFDESQREVILHLINGLKESFIKEKGD